MLEQFVSRPGLDDAPGIEDRDPVGDRRHHCEVVRDQDDREVVLAAQAVEQSQDPRLNRDVERGRRFVGDQQAWAAGERDRDRDALPHPARELVRIGVQRTARIGNAYLLEQVDSPSASPRSVRGRDGGERARSAAARPRASDAERSSGPGRPSRCRAPRPRAGRVALSASRSCPPKRRAPSTTAPAGSSPSSASIDIVLPLPLSPATPKTWAGSTS